MSKLKVQHYLATLAIVYGDIGTSPLYTFRKFFEITQLPINIDNVLGALALLFWSLTLFVTIKYVMFLLNLSLLGEGGILVLFKYAEQVKSKKIKQWALVFSLLGAAFFYGDCALTPAISVISALEGLSLISSSFVPYVQVFTIVILILLFALQKRGTARIGQFFGPIMLVWFACLAYYGAKAIIKQPIVIQALSPWYGIRFIVSNPRLGLLSLGAIVLAITGAEALYSDLGHFGKKPIQVIWFALVFPALVLNYFGQGALLLENKLYIDNPFYNLFPKSGLVFFVILSTLATVIASQAVISGLFSITNQAIKLKFLPQLKVIITSKLNTGQIYIPIANFLALIFSVLAVLIFKNSTEMTASYGLAVTGNMLMTSALAGILCRKIFNYPWTKWCLIFIPLLLLELVFFATNLRKAVDGAWFVLLISALFLIVVAWKRYRLHQTAKF